MLILIGAFRRGSGGGGGGGARGPKTTRTEQKRSKSDNHEAKYRLKRTPKTLNTLKFSQKKSCEVGGGGPKGAQGEIFFSYK